MDARWIDRGGSCTSVSPADGHAGAVARAALTVGARWAAVLVADPLTTGWRIRCAAPRVHDDRTSPLRPLLRVVERLAVMHGAAPGDSRLTLARLRQSERGDALFAASWPAGLEVASSARSLLALAARSAWAADESADEIGGFRCAYGAAAHVEHTLGTVAREAAALAHDFNNALTSILGFSEWLVSDGQPVQPIRTELTHIHQSALAASAVVERLQTLVQPYRRLGRLTPADGARGGPAVPQPGGPGTAPANAPAPGTLTVLVVDDQPEVCESLRAILEKLGHHAVTALNGEMALEALAARAFDLLLTDLSMPRMTGLELARRTAGVGPRTPVILMTGWGEEQDTHANDGVLLVLAKPVTLGALRDAVRSVVARAA